MPGRNGSTGEYRYGFNGMEKDDEVKGSGNSYTTEFRQYDPRIARWKSLDPLMAKYSNQSPYLGFNGNPILFSDPSGLEGKVDKDGDAEGTYVFYNEEGMDGSEYEQKVNEAIDKIKQGFKDNGIGVNDEKLIFVVNNGPSSKKEVKSLFRESKMNNVVHILDKSSGRSHTKNKREINLLTDDMSGLAFHEVLHTFGLSDRYMDIVYYNDAKVIEATTSIPLGGGLLAEKDGMYRANDNAMSSEGSTNLTPYQLNIMRRSKPERSWDKGFVIIANSTMDEINSVVVERGSKLHGSLRIYSGNNDRGGFARNYVKQDVFGNIRGNDNGLFGNKPGVNQERVRTNIHLFKTRNE